MSNSEVVDAPEVEDVEFTPREPGTLPWFKMYPNRWLSSPTIREMGASGEVVYLHLILTIWRDGAVPMRPWYMADAIRIPYKKLLLWLAKWDGELACAKCGRSLKGFYKSLPLHSQNGSEREVEWKCNGSEMEVGRKCGGSEVEVPKLSELQCLSRKSTADIVGDKNRVDQSKSNSIPTSSAKKSKTKPAARVSGSASGKDSSPDPVRWPGETDPNCKKCGGRGNWIEEAGGVRRTVPCPCAAELDALMG